MSSERELRSEVEELRDEVSTLRDTLNEQIGLFADERKRWEEERIKVFISSFCKYVLQRRVSSII